MKNGLIIFPKLLLLFISFSVYAQSEADLTKLQNHAICILPGGPFDGFLYIPPDEQNLLAPAEKNLALGVSYVTNGGSIPSYGLNCVSWPVEARAAFEYALGLWAPFLDSDHPVTVRACWSEDLSGLTLGAAGAAGLEFDFSTDCLLAAPLAESIFNDPDLYDPHEILAVFNGNLGSWYFGTDGQPGGSEFDFVTVALHEIGHGLGFSGFENYDDGNSSNGIECNDNAGHGCLGAEAFGRQFISAFSKTVQTDDGIPVENITNPSADMGNLFTGKSLNGGTGGLFLGGLNVLAANGNVPAKLYTPSTFDAGSSYSHFDDATFPTELMQPILNSGQAIHDPGLAYQHLKDMGWNSTFLPVELTYFDATAKEKTVDLNWITATETNNQGFEIERSGNGKDWEIIGFTSGHGTTTEETNYQYKDQSPLPGISYYRLVQIDWDGEVTKSKIVSAKIFESLTTVEVFPNPVSDQIIIESGSAVTAPIHYQISSSVGKVIWQGVLENRRLEINCQNWPSGIYTLTTEDHTQIKIVKSI